MASTAHDASARLDHSPRWVIRYTALVKPFTGPLARSLYPSRSTESTVIQEHPMFSRCITPDDYPGPEFMRQKIANDAETAITGDIVLSPAGVGVTDFFFDQSRGERKRLRRDLATKSLGPKSRSPQSYLIAWNVMTFALIRSCLLTSRPRSAAALSASRRAPLAGGSRHGTGAVSSCCSPTLRRTPSSAGARETVSECSCGLAATPALIRRRWRSRAPTASRSIGRDGC